jgi:hypothetical protein
MSGIMNFNVKLLASLTVAIFATNEVEVPWVGEVDGIRARVVIGLCRIYVAVNVVLVIHLHNIMILLVVRENCMLGTENRLLLINYVVNN